MRKKSIDATLDATEFGQKRNELWDRLDRLFDSRRLVLGVFLIGVIVMVLYKPFARPEVGDPTIYDYVAQSILRGELPYRDTIDIKAPGSQYLSAAAIAVGRVFGVRDIFAIRTLHVILVGVLCAVTFIVSNVYYPSRVAALIAVLIPLLREPIAKVFIGGTQPKLPMIIFGLLTLWMIARDRPLWAGVFSMLSCLCWQPGLLFTGTAVLIFSRYLTSLRDLKALKVIVGAAIPLLIVIGYFYSKGALGDLWAWTIKYNYSVFGPEAGPSLGNAIRHIVMMSRRVFEKEILIVGLSVIGMVFFLYERIRARLRKGGLADPDLFRDAIVFPPLIYGAFMLVSFQGPPDLIPLFPFVGIFAGWLIVRIARAAGNLKPLRRYPQPLMSSIIGVAVVAIIFGVVLVRAARFKLGGLKLQDQDASIQQLIGQFQPDDKIYVHGVLEILVLMDKPNLNPYVDFDWGKDNFLAASRGVSFDQLIAEMEFQAPKYVAIARLRKVYHRTELEQWVNEHYRPLGLRYFRSLYVRK